MYAGGARFDHHFHELEGIQRAAESGFGIGDDRCHKVHTILSVHVMNLVGTHQRVVDAANHVGHAIHRIKALVRVHVPAVICVGRDLPAAEIDGFKSRLHLLHRLIAGERAQRRHVVFVMQQPPQPLSAQAGQCVLNLERAPQLLNLLAAVWALGASPARVTMPLLGHFGGAESMHGCHVLSGVPVQHQ